MRPNELAEFLIFRGLTPAQRIRLAPLFSPVNFANGETIFAQDEPADTVYVLEEGVVTLRYQPEGRECLTLATIYRGGVFGWSALLGQPGYLASAICLAKSRALAVPGDKLRALIRGEPELSILLGRMALAVATRQAEAPFQIMSLINQEISN